MAESRQSFGFPLSVAIYSDVGRVRDNNEDSHGHAWLEDSSLFVIVADGMGGHEAGEVASGLAVQVMEEVVTGAVNEDPRTRLYNGCLEANEAILDEGRRSGTSGMGTTIVSAILQGSEANICLVGDSRAYHVRKGHVVWRTKDHTRVQMLIDQGMISEEESRDHPEAGMLTRALGHSRMADGRPLEPHVEPEPVALEEMDALVMCSDGLHDLVEDWEIAKVVAGKQADEISQELIELACERGGHDNVTVAVVVGGRRAGDFDPSFLPPAPIHYAEPDDEQAEPTFDGLKRDDGGDMLTDDSVQLPLSAQTEETMAEGAASSGNKKTLLIAGAVIGLGLLGLGVVAILGLLAFFMM